MDRILKHNFNFGPNLPRNKFCDAKVRVKDSTRLIPIHRVILAAVSRKFEKMFEENPGTDTTYMISEVKFETLNKIVEYIYTGQALFANDGDFWVGLVLLSINLGEVEVENIKTKVETKPFMEEYIEMGPEGCQLKSEIEEGCDELVTSSSSLELTNIDPCHHSGFPAATGPNSSISIHAENLAPNDTAGQENKVDGGKSHSCSNSLMINVEDVVAGDTPEEDMARKLVVQQAAAVEEKLKLSSTEVATYNSMTGGSIVTFTNKKGDSNLKIDNPIDASENNEFVIQQVQLEDKDMENISKMKVKMTGEKEWNDVYNLKISSKKKPFKATKRRVFELAGNSTGSQRRVFKLAGMDVDSQGVKSDEAKKSPGRSPLKYQKVSGGITGSEEDTMKFCSSGSVSNFDQDTAQIRLNTRNNPALVRINTETNIVIDDNNEIQNMDQEKSSSSIYGPKTLEKRSETASVIDKVNMKKNIKSNKVKFRKKRQSSDNDDNLKLTDKKILDFKSSCPIQDHSDSKCGAMECRGVLKLYPCTHKHGGCKDVFPEKTELHKHARRCKHRPKTSFSCQHSGCTKRYYYKEDYEKHFANSHPPSQ